MKFLLSFFLFCFSLSVSAQSVLGVWKTKSDVDGAEKSNVEIFEKDGRVYGKIIKLLGDAEGDKCIACKGDKKDAPLVGMEIIWGLKKKKSGYDGGKILDPNTGKVYKCKISLGDNVNELDVRGYIGFSLVGRTQTWYRVE